MTLELLYNGTARKYLLQEALGQDRISPPHQKEIRGFFTKHDKEHHIYDGLSDLSDE